MAQIPFPFYPRALVPVGTVLDIVIPPLDMRKHNTALLELENLGTDTFTGTIWTSMDGTDPWVPLADDSFSVMAPGPGQVPRVAKVPADMLWVRVTGKFSVASGNMRRAAYLLQTDAWK